MRKETYDNLSIGMAALTFSAIVSLNALLNQGYQDPNEKANVTKTKPAQELRMSNSDLRDQYQRHDFGL
ncbi:Uncharacterised protein [uncultured archaeon]|nr:Uncharacterised protein [uncultured archaeon]